MHACVYVYVYVHVSLYILYMLVYIYIYMFIYRYLYMSLQKRVDTSECSCVHCVYAYPQTLRGVQRPLGTLSGPS